MLEQLDLKTKMPSEAPVLKTGKSSVAAEEIVTGEYLLVIEDDRGCRQILLDGPIYSIGRDSMCDIRIHSQFVSRRHATLVQLNDDDGTPYYRIVDGNLKGKLSVNGLLINNRKLKASDLTNGDVITFGPGAKATFYRAESV